MGHIQVTEEQFLKLAVTFKRTFWSEDTKLPQPYPLVLNTYRERDGNSHKGAREVGRIVYLPNEQKEHYISKDV